MNSYLNQTPRRVRSSVRSAILAGLCVALAQIATSAGVANANLINTGACDSSTLTQPFATWGDQNLYKLAPGGDIEGSLSGWTLTSGATRVSGSEPYRATGKAGAYALSLKPGAYAQTPFTCVNASYPTFRFFAVNSTVIGTVLVQVVYHDALGTRVIPVSVVTVGTTWRPTAAALTGSVAAALLSDGTAQMAIRLTAVTGTTQVDDIFVDPRMH